MATNSLQVNTSASVAGLGTTTFNVTADGFYTVECKSTLPLSSNLTIDIKLNNVSKVSSGGASTNPTPTQQSLASVAKLQCVATDVITVVLSSSNNVDGLPNSVKSVINIFQGE